MLFLFTPAEIGMNVMQTPVVSIGQTDSIRLLDVPVERCSHSRFNTRKTRAPEVIDRLAQRIKRNGFERTRALWTIEADGCYEVFAGGTRLEAARQAGMKTVPVFVHDGLSDEQISRKADEDNENDEYHERVGLLDVWAECYRLWKEEAWTQEQIATAKGWQRTTVSRRIRWHQSLSKSARRAVCDGILDEGHLEAISTVMCDVAHSKWLTTEQAQTELVQEVLGKHRGSTAGIKPTVKVVRDTAKRWTALLHAAEAAYQSLSEDGPWREQFIDLLAANRARTEAAVNTALNQVVDNKRRDDEATATQLRAEADAKEQEAQLLRKKQARLTYLQTQTEKLRCGDARALIDQAPSGFHLLLSDPPYGVEFRSHRRVTSVKKHAIANDDKQAALSLLADVLAKAYPRMAENASCLIFTSWRNEPDFRRIVEAADWMIDVHHVLRRSKNTGYAFEGIVSAYEVARMRGDAVHAEKFACVIEDGLAKLTSWQVGHPLANEHVQKADAADALAVGGVQNSADEAPLRVDTTQHQMHAVILARRYYLKQRSL